MNRKRSGLILGITLYKDVQFVTNKKKIDEYSLEVTRYVFEVIKQTRKEKKLTILELAAICDVSPGYLSDLENQKHPNASLRFLLKVCITLDLNLDKVLQTAIMKLGEFHEIE